MVEEVVAIEVCEKEFERFAEGMDIEVDTKYMDDEDTASLEKHKRRLIKAMRKGSLVINDNCEAVYTPVKSKVDDPLTFYEREADMLTAMDNKKKGHDVLKTYVVMAAMTKVHSRTIFKLKGVDLKTCESIFLLLMD